MSLDLAPAPGAAPAARRVWAHSRTEAAMLVRNGEQLLLTLVIPVALLVGGHLTAARFGVDLRTFPASVLALALWSTGFTALAITTAFERRYGVLERLAATPLGRSGLLAGKALAITMIALGQLVVLALIALALGWRPAVAPLPLLVAVGTALLATYAFANLGLALAGRLRAEAVLGVSNLAYLLLAAVGAVVAPVAAYPAPLRPLIAALPTAALGEAFRASAAGATTWWPLPVAALWAAIAMLLSRKAFRWTS